MMKSKTKIFQLLITLVSAVVLGMAIAFSYLVFEWIVNDGSNFIWNDVFKSDVYRWRVLPIAMGLSIVLSVVYKLFKQERIQELETDLLKEISANNPSSLTDIMTIFSIGAACLLAGASLGPEASLLAGVISISAWISGLFKHIDKPLTKLFSLASVGGLLCAFMLSIIPILIPLVLLKKSKKLTLQSAFIVIVICATSWLIVFLIKGTAYGEIPINETFSGIDYIVALGLGFFTVLIGIILKWVIKILAIQARYIDKQFHWVLSATIFGGVLGLLYLFGGQSIEFSGNQGSQLLEANRLMYSSLALLAMVGFKLLATAWSLTSGYRGGLVFPSVYMGLAFSYAIIAAFSLTGVESAGATIGAVSGIFVTMLSPTLGIVLLLSAFPINLVFVVMTGVMGALAGVRVFEKIPSATRH
jgi:H+/Cl- antiporter ClcA